jgi:hypothetical protein
LAYLAGFVDGEGCMRWESTPIIEIRNTYPYTLVEIYKTFGGRIRVRPATRPRERTTWVWSVCGEAARCCLAAVMPFLGEKRRQAEALLQISEFPPRSSQRLRLIDELCRLKRVDYGDRSELC